MPDNLQPIPLGLIGVHSAIDFVVSVGEAMEPGDTTYQNDNFVYSPSVYIDGLLITEQVRTDRRYISFDPSTRTITINNGGVNEGENVQIFY